MTDKPMTIDELRELIGDDPEFKDEIFNEIVWPMLYKEMEAARTIMKGVLLREATKDRLRYLNKSFGLGILCGVSAATSVSLFARSFGVWWWG